MLKKAFTLFELIIVIVLVGIIYYLTLSNFSTKQQTVNSLTLINLKEKLSSMEFSEEITIKCIDNNEIECLLLIDNIVQKEKIKDLFTKCPDVYEYSKDQEKIEFLDLELEKFERHEICFSYSVYKDGTSSQMIVDTSDDVFIYDNISSKPKRIKYLNDIGLYFDDKISEVKDAF